MSTPSTFEVFSGDVFYPGGIDGPEVVGDIEFMSGGDVGGDDSFSGASESESYVAFGDAYVMTDSAVGGDDYFLGGDNVYSGNSLPLIEPLPSGASDVTGLDTLFFFSGGVQFAGDSAIMDGRAAGGNDTMLGGVNSSNLFVGDALEAAYGRSVGGGDWLVGGAAEDGYATNVILGDAGQFGYSGGGDIRSLDGKSSSSNSVRGGADYIEGGSAIGESFGTGNANFLVGDAYAIYGRSTGGSDEIHGGSAVAYGDTGDSFDAAAINFIAGDAFGLEGTATGGADDLYGGTAYSSGGDAYAINLIAGDSFDMYGQVRAGGDMLTGGDAHGADFEVNVATDGYGTATMNLMAGDTFYAQGGASFGDDEMVGGVGTGDGYVVNAMYGDVGDPSFIIGPPTLDSVSALSSSVSASAHGSAALIYGDDMLIGGASQADNFLVGDAQEFFGKGTRGGDDVLIGGGVDTSNMLIGDAVVMGTGTKGGNDILVSNGGNDQMWGDGQSFSMGGGGRGGSDIFVFGPENGVDVINDFRTRDRDKIDLSDFGNDPDFRNFKAFVASERMEQTDQGVVLHLDQQLDQVQVDNVIETDTVLIVGVTLAQLTSSAFIF